MFNTTRKIIILCGCLAMALMLSIQVYAINPRIDPPDAFGAFRVGVSHIITEDQSRKWRGSENNFPIELYVWYPRGDESGTEVVYKAHPLTAELPSAVGALVDAAVSTNGPFPMIVFSHGNTSLTGYFHSRLFETLASHGFIVVAPLHTGNTFSDELIDGLNETPVYALECPLSGSGQTTPCLNDSAADASLNRMLDITFAIDLILAKNSTAGDLLYGAIDEENIGAMGYSRGASTIVGLAQGAPAFGIEKDDRLDALMFIDGFFLHQIDEWPLFLPTGADNIDAATLTLAGSDHPALPPGFLGLSAAELANEALTVSPRYLVTIPNSGHIAFLDVCTVQEAVADASNLDDPYTFDPSMPSDIFKFLSSPDAAVSMNLYNLSARSGIFYGTNHQCRDITHPNFIVDELEPPLNDPAEVNRLVELYAVSFFNVKLSGKRRYQPYLTPDYAEQNEPLADLEVTGGKGE